MAESNCGPHYRIELRNQAVGFGYHETSRLKLITPPTTAICDGSVSRVYSARCIVDVSFKLKIKSSAVGKVLPQFLFEHPKGAKCGPGKYNLKVSFLKIK